MTSAPRILLLSVAVAATLSASLAACQRREEKAPARALYESLGFRTDAAIRGYRGTRSGS